MKQTRHDIKPRHIIIMVTICAFVVNTLAAKDFAITSSTQMPRVGDSYPVDKVELDELERLSKGSVWDFSTATIIDGSQKITYEAIDTLTLVQKLDHNRRMLRVSGDSLLWAGFENRKVYLKDSVPALVFRYPFAYKDSISSPYHFIGQLRIDRAISDVGYATCVADAHGTLILPGFDTIANILRVRSEFVSNSDIKFRKSQLNKCFTDTLPKSITRIYEWYASGYRYPLATIIENHIIGEDDIVSLQSRAIYLCSRSEMAAAILNDPENETIRKNSQRELHCQRNDNSEKDLPSLSDITVHISPEGILDVRFNSHTYSGEMELIVCDTKALPYITIPRRKVEPGDNLIQIDCSSLPSGEYALMLLWGSEKISVKFAR